VKHQRGFRSIWQNFFDKYPVLLRRVLLFERADADIDLSLTIDIYNVFGIKNNT